MASIQIEVSPQYIAAESNPDKHRYVYAYTVSIRNNDKISVQLLSRHWIITNGESLKTMEVRGDGVIGQQPKLAPGEEFIYTSGTVMESAVGTMEGSYKMIDENGEYFDAHIPVFTLASLNSVH